MSLKFSKANSECPEETHAEDSVAIWVFSRQAWYNKQFKLATMVLGNFQLKSPVFMYDTLRFELVVSHQSLVAGL